MSFVDAFGDRLKGHEVVQTGRRLDPRSGPVYARLDGRGFSKFTRGMRRPYDERMLEAMQRATATIVDHSGALIGYHQSDEISLVWSTADADPLAEMMFGGKIQKLCSVLASYTTAAFTQAILASGDGEFQGFLGRMPHFDCRVFALPDREEGANALLWRVKDAERNAVQMVAQANYSHRQLQGVPTREILAMMARDGIAFDTLPEPFRHGSFFRRRTFERPIDEATRLRIPAGRRPPQGTIVTRSEVTRVDSIASFSNVVNRAEVVFDGAEPITYV